MTTLTDKQAKWLRKAMGDRIQMQRVYVAEFDGLLYAATTDGHRLHAIPVEGIEPGQYDLFDRTLYAINEAKTHYESWPQIVPTQFFYKQIVTLEKLSDLRAKANEYEAIRVYEWLDIWLNYKYYYDATHYNGQCEMRVQSATKPVRFDYSNGAIAVVMPMNVGKMR